MDEHSSSEDLPYKFNGKQFDEETGLYYYGARYLIPVTSLWYGVDPLAEKYPTAGGFVYCIDNPVKLVDPNGKKILPTLYNKVNRGHSKAEGSDYRSNKTYMSAMKRFASTTYGNGFIGDFLEKGSSHYGANGTGRFYGFRNLIWGMLTILSKETIWVIIMVRLTSSSVIISYM